MTQTLLVSLATARASPWYDNGWVIGIVTGLVSGALLAAVTPLFLRKRRARDLAIRRERAADDLLSALRPSVATGNLPSASVVEAIARASAYKRGLDPKFAASTLTLTLLDVLVSEIMVSAFLAPETRLSLAQQLLALREELDSQLISKQPLDGRGSYRAETIIASVGGAAVLGGAAAASATFGSWVPFFAILTVGVVGIAATLIIGLMKPRLTRLTLGGVDISIDSFGEGTLNISESESDRPNGKDVPASDYRRAADGEPPHGTS